MSHLKWAGQTGFSALQRTSPVLLKCLWQTWRFFRVGGERFVSCPALTEHWLDAISLWAPRTELHCEKYTDIINPWPALKVQWSMFASGLLHRARGLHEGTGGCWLGLKQRRTSVYIDTKTKQKLGRGFAVMSGQPRFVSPFYRPRCLAAAAPAGKAKLTHPGKAILAGKKVCPQGCCTTGGCYSCLHVVGLSQCVQMWSEPSGYSTAY